MLYCVRHLGTRTRTRTYKAKRLFFDKVVARADRPTPSQLIRVPPSFFHVDPFAASSSTAWVVALRIESCLSVEKGYARAHLFTWVLQFFWFLFRPMRTLTAISYARLVSSCLCGPVAASVVPSLSTLINPLGRHPPVDPSVVRRRPRANTLRVRIRVQASPPRPCPPGGSSLAFWVFFADETRRTRGPYRRQVGSNLIRTGSALFSADDN